MGLLFSCCREYATSGASKVSEENKLSRNEINKRKNYLMNIYPSNLVEPNYQGNYFMLCKGYTDEECVIDVISKLELLNCIFDGFVTSKNGKNYVKYYKIQTTRCCRSPIEQGEINGKKYIKFIFY